MNHMCADTHGGWKRVPAPLELELQPVVSLLTHVLGTRLGSSAGAVQALSAGSSPQIITREGFPLPLLLLNTRLKVAPRAIKQHKEKSLNVLLPICRKQGEKLELTNVFSKIETYRISWGFDIAVVSNKGSTFFVFI